MGYNGHVVFNNIIGDLIDSNVEGTYHITEERINVYKLLYTTFLNLQTKSTCL